MTSGQNLAVRAATATRTKERFGGTKKRGNITNQLVDLQIAGLPGNSFAVRGVDSIGAFIKEEL